MTGYPWMIHRCLGEPQGWYKGTHRGQLAVKETYITRKLQLLTYLSYFPLQSQSPMVNERPYQVFHARVRSRLRVCITVIYVPRIASKDRHRSLLDLILYLQLLDFQCTKYTENHRLLVMLMIEIVIIKSCHSSLIIQAGMSDFTDQ